MFMNTMIMVNYNQKLVFLTASSMVDILNGLKMEKLKNRVNIAMVNPMGFMKYGLKMGRSAKKVIGLKTVII